MATKIYHTYRYTNILNGMKYNGQTYQEQSHRAGKNGHGYKGCTRFWEAIQQDGWGNFKCEILEEGLTQEEAWLKEQEHIKEDNSQWPNGYNTSGGGKSSFYGIHENYKTGKKHTEETKTKIGIANSKALKGKPQPWNWRKVRQLTKDGQFIAEYSSIKEAQEQTGVSRSHISSCCSGNRKSAGGSMWEYA